MSYEFTKLSDVPVVAEFPEGANAIIETNGEIKRCPSGGGGGGYGGNATGSGGGGYGIGNYGKGGDGNTGGQNGADGICVITWIAQES